MQRGIPPTPRKKRAGSRSTGTNPRALGTNPKARGTNPRAMGTNPIALGTNLRAVRALEEFKQSKVT